MKFNETSAKSAKGVDEMIEDMVLDIMSKGGFEPRTETIKLAVESDRKQQENDGCC
jgi:hypothetical protein